MLRPYDLMWKKGDFPAGIFLRSFNDSFKDACFPY
jgi:hypothetical protein